MKCKALIIDDEPLASGLVAEHLAPFEQIEVVGQYHDGFAGLKAIQEHRPDLVFLDIQMPKLSGLELLELLEEERPAVIFTTAFDQYALQAFEARAVDYLLKPFSEERFQQAVEKFLAQPQHLRQNAERLQQSPELQERRDRLVIKDGGRIRLIPYEQLIRLEADGDYVLIRTEQGKFMQKKTLRYFEERLPAQQFLRVHRSHLINLSHVQRIDPYGKNDHLARLQNQEQVPVSRAGYQRLKTLLDV